MKSCDCGQSLAGGCSCAERESAKDGGGRYRHLIVQPPQEPPAVTFRGVDNGVTYKVDVRSGDVLFIRPVHLVNRPGEGGGDRGVWVRVGALAEVVEHFAGGASADHG